MCVGGGGRKSTYFEFTQLEQDLSSREADTSDAIMSEIDGLGEDFEGRLEVAYGLIDLSDGREDEGVVGVNFAGMVEEEESETEAILLEEALAEAEEGVVVGARVAPDRLSEKHQTPRVFR